MTRRSLTRVLATTATGAVLVISAAAPATAHVSMSASSTAPGDYAVLTVSVPHGCEGSPTTQVAIQVPASIESVTPTRNPFWTVGTGTAGTIVYTALTPLPDGQRDTFELSLRLPEEEGPLVFPTIQTCEKGRTSWVETPAEGQDAHSLDHPAPTIEVTSAEVATAGATTAGATTAEEDRPVDSAGARFGLGVGLLGLLLGATALLRARRRS